MLANSFDVAHAYAETYHALNLLHLGPGDVRDEDLSELYGEPKPVVAYIPKLDDYQSGKGPRMHCRRAPPYLTA